MKISFFFCKVVAATALTLSGCLQFRMTPAEIDNYFVDEHAKPKLRTYSVEDRRIHYAELENNKQPLVLFVHGSPGSWTAFKDFFADTALTHHAKLIAVDRPGFGYSDFGFPEPSIERQAALIKPILEKNKNHHPVILVGHSLGGPVIARLAIDYPEMVDGLVFLSASVDPELEPNEWYRHALRLPVINLLVPTSFYVSNEEILPLKGELVALLPFWEKIKAPAMVVHGEKDTWVPIGNAYFIKAMLKNTSTELVIIQNARHFILWTHPGVISKIIGDLIERNHSG